MPGPLEATDPADPKEAAEWGKAAKYMLGGTDEGSDEEAGSEETAREFRYRGKVIKTDAETLEVLESLRKEARGVNGRLGSELARTKERLARMEGAIAARETHREDTRPTITPPDPMLATRDIAAWQKQMLDYDAAVRAQERQDLERRYADDQEAARKKAAEDDRTKAWADRFYATYEYLDDSATKRIVTDAYLDNQAEIDSFGSDIEGAHERLAELADERLLRVKKAGRVAEEQTPNDNRRRPPTFESSARATPKRAEAVDESRRDFSASSWSARERLKMTGREPRKER